MLKLELSVLNQWLREKILEIKYLVGIDVIKYCKKLYRDLIVKSENTRIKIFKLSGEPPDVEVSVFLHNDFRVDAYRRMKKIPLRDIIDGFSNCVNKFSQIDVITSRLNANSNANSLLEFKSKLKNGNLLDASVNFAAHIYIIWDM